MTGLIYSPDFPSLNALTVNHHALPYRTPSPWHQAPRQRERLPWPKSVPEVCPARTDADAYPPWRRPAHLRIL